jgi:hypothetical protein
MNALDIFTKITMYNGMYIPFIYAGLYFITQDLFLSTTIALKTYTVNYFYWFGSHYNYLPQKYNWIKQFIRFTDTGSIASMIYYVYPEFLPVAFNVHFTITFGYWIAKFQFGMKDTDDINDPLIIKWIEELYCTCNHSLALSILSYRAYYYSHFHECHPLFTWQQLTYSYYWLYVWFLCIYIPWRLYTNDCVYSVLDKKTPIQQQLAVVAMIHVLLFMGNTTGYMLQTC